MKCRASRNTWWHRDLFHRVTVVLNGGLLEIEFRDGEQQPPGGSISSISENRVPSLNPRFACLSRRPKDLGGHLESLTLLGLQHSVAPKMVAFSNAQ
jgi:hypothetical protein